MDRAIPRGNRILWEREEQRRADLHRTRLRNAKPQVDTAEPHAAHMSHVRKNVKREMREEERYSQIDRENRLLLKKMTDIARQQGPATDRPGPTSLNQATRRKELLRITKENQGILGRIQQAQPVYNRVDWEGSHRQHVAYLKNCTEFPLILKPPRKLNLSSELVPLEVEAPHGGAATARDYGRPTNDDTRIVLKEGKAIGDKYYLLEMAIDGRGLHIRAYDGEADVTRELEVRELVHRRLYREANGDYRCIAEKLRLQGHQLVLDERTSERPKHAVPQPTPKTQAAAVPDRGLDDEIDADDMVVVTAKPDSAGSVCAEIEFSATGNALFKIRGLTPSTGCETPTSL